MSQLDIATLTVLLQANSAQFETQMAQARSTAQREARNISKEIKKSSQESRAELALLGEMFGVTIPREIRKSLSEFALFRNIAAGALAVTAAVILIEKLGEITDKIKSGAQELGGFTKAMQDFDKANIEASRHAQVNPTTIGQGQKNLTDLNTQLQQVQAEAAKARAEMEHLGAKTVAANAGAGLLGPIGMAAGIKSQIEQFMRVRDLDNESVRLEEQRLKLIEEMTKMTAQHAANMEQLNHQLATSGLQGVQKSAADIAYLGEQLKKAQTEGNRFKVDEIGKQIQIATKEMNGEALRSGLERLQQLKNILSGLNSIGSQALASSETDPFVKIAHERDQRLQEIENKRTENFKGSSDQRQQIEMVAAFNIVKVNAAAAAQIATEYQKAEESVAKITTELSKAQPFLQLKFPNPMEGVTSGHGVLDVTAERIREITRDTKTLEQATLGYLQQVQNETQKYATDLAAVNAAYHAGLISVTQLNDLTKKLNPNFQRMQELGKEAARTIVSGFEQAVISGGGLRDILAGVLEDLAKIILEAALNPFEKALGGILGNIFSGLGGGGTLFGADAIRAGAGRAMGGSVNAGTPYVVGEHGPELMVPSASGSIIPNGSIGGTTVVYQIDARGADAGVEQRVMRAIDQSRKQAVRESVVTMREQSLRST